MKTDKNDAFNDLIASLVVPITRFSKRDDLTPAERAIVQRLGDDIENKLTQLEDRIDA